MKKIILLITSLLLALALCLLFAACDDETTTPAASGATTTPAAGTTAAPASDGGTTPAPGTTAAPATDETTTPTVGERTPWELLGDAVVKTLTPGENAAYDALAAALAEGCTVDFSLVPNLGSAAAEGPVLPFDRFTGKMIAGKDGVYADVAFGLGQKTSNLRLQTTQNGLAFSSSVWDKVYGLTAEDLAALLGQFVGSANGAGSLLSADSSATLPFPVSIESVQALLAAIGEALPAEQSEQNGLVVITVSLTAEKLKTVVTKVNDVVKAHADLAALFPPMSDEELKETVDNIAGPGAITLTVTLNENETIRSAVLSSAGMEDIDANFTVALTMTENGGFTVDITNAENEKTSIAWTAAKEGDETTYSLTVETASAALAAPGVSVKLTLLTIVYNEKTGAYTVTVMIPATMTVEIAGKFSVSENDLTFALDTVNVTMYDGTEQVTSNDLQINLTVKVTAEHTLPAVPEVDANILEMSDEEGEAMIEALENDEIFGGVLAFFAALGESATPNPPIE